MERPQTKYKLTCPDIIVGYLLRDGRPGIQEALSTDPSDKEQTGSLH